MNKEIIKFDNNINMLKCLIYECLSSDEKYYCEEFEKILHYDNFSDGWLYYYNPYENVKIRSFCDIVEFQKSVNNKYPMYSIITLMEIYDPYNEEVSLGEWEPDGEENTLIFYNDWC